MTLMSETRGRPLVTWDTHMDKWNPPERTRGSPRFEPKRGSGGNEGASGPGRGFWILWSKKRRAGDPFMEKADVPVSFVD